MNLYIKQHIFSFGDKYQIYDVEQNPVFNAWGEVFTMGNKIHLCDTNNRELIYIQQKVMSFMPTFYLYTDNNLLATIKQEFTFFKKNISVESSYGNFEIVGDFWDHEYSIICNGRVLGKVSKEWLTWGDVYSLEIFEESRSQFFVALVLTIDCILEGEKNSNTGFM